MLGEGRRGLLLNQPVCQELGVALNPIRASTAARDSDIHSRLSVTAQQEPPFDLVAGDKSVGHNSRNRRTFSIALFANFVHKMGVPFEALIPYGIIVAVRNVFTRR